MSRYQQAPIGVTDTTTGQLIVPSMAAEWSDYRAWLDAGNIPDPPPPPQPITPQQIALARIERRLAVNEVRAQHYALGVQFLGHPWESDRDSRLRILEVLTMVAGGISLPAGFTWRAADNVDVPMTAVQMVGLLRAIRTSTQAIFDYSVALKAQIDGAADPQTVDITQGWPA